MNISIEQLVVYEKQKEKERQEREISRMPAELEQPAYEEIIKVNETEVTYESCVVTIAM
tara:strand:- start:10836 stop:11012 length:177 start_codon:yes stop_codon:yes gene_type:complete